MKYLLKKFIKQFSGLLSIVTFLLVGSLATGDFSGFFRTIIRFYWLLGPIAIMLILIPFWPSIKGGIGENRVRRMLRRLDPELYTVLYNVFIRLPDGRTTQIDHIVISTKGIFVIETKNYSGWIYGDEKSEYWTQKIYRSTKKFKNPLHQNYGHIKALQEVLQDEKTLQYYSIVVFTGSAELKKMTSQNVVKLNQLVPYILSHQIEVISSETKERISNRISAFDKAKRKDIKEHINEIKDKVADNGKICPKCGQYLVERKGKYGNFLGCSGFPKCRYIYKGDKVQ